MTHAESTFIQNWPLLFSISYRLTGSVPDSEDIVQDTFLKWLGVDHSTVVDSKAYLSRSVMNQTLNFLKSFRETREIAMSSWIQENVTKRYEEFDFNSLDFRTEMEEAFGNLMKKLTPSERGVYLLREVFDFSYNDLTKIFEQKTDHCRKLFSRAQQKLDDQRTRFRLDVPKSKELRENFMNAYQNFDFTELVENLKKDVNLPLKAKKDSK